MDELMALARDRFDAAAETERVTRNNAEEDFSFAAGDQWPSNVKNSRKATDRPCLTFNRLPQFIQQVVGDARQNKPSIKVSPVDSGADVENAEVYEGLIRNIEAESRATQAYITALEHATTGGFGNWRIVTQFSNDDGFDQDIRIKRITDPFAVYWDPGAREYDKSDAHWCFVSEWITKEEFEERFPDKLPTDWKRTYQGLNTREEWINDDRVRLVEYWVKKFETVEIGLTQTGEVHEQLLEGFTYARTRKVERPKVCRYLLSGHEVLEDQREFPSAYIPIVPVFGPEEYQNGVIRPRSLIRYAKDPMRMYNFWQTTIAEKLALAPKAPWLVTPEMIKGLSEHWNAANRENRAYLPYNPDPKAPSGKPERQDPAYVQAAEIQQSAQAIDDLKATMGMYDASLGNAGNEQSGRAIIARQREGDTASYAWIDNLARSIQHTGRILIDMIPRVYDTDRIIRVLGEDDSVDMVPINHHDPATGEKVHDLSFGKYDVQITVGPSYATKRMEAADSMLGFIQAVPQAAQVAGDLIAKAMDWPGAEDIAERLRMLLPPGIDPELDAERPQPPPDPEVVKAEQEGEFKSREQDRKEHESINKMMMDKVKREGMELDNMDKAFELAMASGQFEELVAAKVQEVLQGFAA